MEEESKSFGRVNENANVRRQDNNFGRLQSRDLSQINEQSESDNPSRDFKLSY